ncbi:MAG: SixA phosphatase family protein [Bryobacteraceae bacterium]
MQIYLLRHGIAEDARPGQPDAARALTQEGKEKLRRVLRRAGAAGARPASIVSSPLRRALETAAVAAEVLGYSGKIAESRALAPEASPFDLWEEIRRRGEEPSILLAGHEPLMSAMVAYLLGCPALQVEMKKAALVRIDCERLAREPRGVLKWMLTPAVSE